MAKVTISLPDPMEEWIETRVRGGDFASASDYIRDLVRRDFDRRGDPLTLDALRERLSGSKASGVSARSVEEIFAQARDVARKAG